MYEEFSICLTLLLAIIHRFGLRPSQLPLKDQASFIGWFLDSDRKSASLKDVPETLQKSLGNWMRALFETEGIEDQMLARHPPQEFYRIAPCIYRQMIIACHSGMLSKKKLRSGLERMWTDITVDLC